MAMRTIILSTAIGALVPAVAAADSITVKSGVKTEVATHMKYDMKCQGTRVVIRITAEPANGTVTTAPKAIVVPEESGRGVKQQSPCVGKTIEGVAVFYEPKPGFVGQDRFRYQRLNPRDPGDLFNQEVSWFVTVE
jgi:hypothetical protein